VRWRLELVIPGNCVGNVDSRNLCSCAGKLDTPREIRYLEGGKNLTEKEGDTKLQVWDAGGTTSLPCHGFNVFLCRLNVFGGAESLPRE
jgi:hypothetical protein